LIQKHLHAKNHPIRLVIDKAGDSMFDEYQTYLYESSCPKKKYSQQIKKTFKEVKNFAKSLVAVLSKYYELEPRVSGSVKI
jgi:hypothetical protein